MQRRDFLHGMGLLAAGTAGAAPLPASAGRIPGRAAGTAVRLSLNAYSFNVPLRDGSMTVDDMITFCTWDGGYLVSEYQWEKAARGAAPDVRRNAWGDADGSCTEHPWMGCRDWPFAMTSFPRSVSPYGMRLISSLFEATSTW